MTTYDLDGNKPGAEPADTGVHTDPLEALIGPGAAEDVVAVPESGESAAELPSGSPADAIEAALGVIPKRPRLPLPRWLGPLAICCVVGLVPWMVYLGFTLPRKQSANHYDLAWLGFDAAMWVVLALLGYSAIKRHPATSALAAVAATMLLVDAWFDVVTSEDGRQFTMAVVLAAVAELPLAIICAWAAFNAERIRSRAYRRLRSRWLKAVEIARASQRASSPRVSDERAAPGSQ